MIGLFDIAITLASAVAAITAVMFIDDTISLLGRDIGCDICDMEDEE